ncbi:MAG: nucleotidyl transferase AbiEii/AbiGii toxin family protein [Ignavibacteria bacterium]|nr:nucleotidyl transferase AbiEii/AbiGii toxin family protein [Ignavibacteria bacterium]
MIDKQTLTTHWINEVSAANRNADKTLVEKAIRALLLLEGLSKVDLPFVFKGGTALMLLLKSVKRLSIDIDIVVSKTQDKIEQYIQLAGQMQGFTKIELQHRTSASEIEKAHYKFFYTPMYRTHPNDDYVLLDILFESNQYNNVTFQELQSHFVVNAGKPALISMPSAEDLLADKLTAFAPNTTGVPYIRNDNSMSMEIIKQLYDVGTLFDVVDDIHVIKATFNNIVQTEIRYRNLTCVSSNEVLEDIYQTSLCISLRGKGGLGRYEELLGGIQRVTNFIFSESYHLEKAIIHAAKAAYMARLIATNQHSFEKFVNPSQIAEATIVAPHNTRLQKLKKSNVEAFFYWWKATQLHNAT